MKYSGGIQVGEIFKTSGLNWQKVHVDQKLFSSWSDEVKVLHLLLQYNDLTKQVIIIINYGT